MENLLTGIATELLVTSVFLVWLKL